MCRLFLEFIAIMASGYGSFILLEIALRFVGNFKDIAQNKIKSNRFDFMIYF